jgi:phosphoglycolate phosphatase
VKAFAQTSSVMFHIPGGTGALCFAGATDLSLVRQYLKTHQLPVTQTNCERFFESYVHLLDQYLGETKNKIPCPGSLELILDFQSLRNPPLIGLLTGNIQLGAEIKLRHFNLWEFFVLGAFGCDHENRNELAAIAQRRASDHLDRQLKGEEILVIGDTPKDIACAQSIGARSLAVATGGSSLNELRPHHPTYLAQSLIDVEAEDLMD